MLCAGNLVYFAKYKAPFFVRLIGADGRYAICTQPYYPKHTCIYTIVDFERKVRGRENLIFGMGAESDVQCAEMMRRLETGESEVSYRHFIPLDIVAD